MPRPSGSADRVGTALVLTAGRGTRLWPLTALRAKPAVPVAGPPLVRRILGWLAARDVRDVILNLHYLPQTITAVVGDGRDLGIRVRYSWEQPLLGSAGGPRHALALLPADRFWIVNGDTLTDVDLDALAAQHDRTGALVTMALVPNPRPESYGGVLVRDGWVTGFTEPGAGGPTYHFIGVQLAEAQVFAELRDGEPAESVSGVYRTLIAARGRAIGAFVSQATFRDIGTPADYLRTSLDLTRLEAHREIPGGARTRVDPGARILRTAMWDDVTVERGAELVECVVVDNVRVPAGSRYARRILMPADRVASRASDALADGLLIAPLDPIA